MTAPVLDAALGVERQLALLTLRLADAAGDHGVGGAYPPDAAGGDAGLPRADARRLGVDEHRAVGAELYRLRERMQSMGVALSRHFRKSSPAGRALHGPERAVDRLRCRLDDLFCARHPAAFDTRVYYPGPAWAGRKPATGSGRGNRPGTRSRDRLLGCGNAAGAKGTDNAD